MGAPITRPGTRGKVLLIDDEEVIRNLGVEMLDEMGFVCITTANGEEGVRLYKNQKDDILLVILDIELPDITGDQVYDRLKAFDPEVKILLISGYTKQYIESRYFHRKLEHFLEKPLRMELLSREMAKLVNI